MKIRYIAGMIVSAIILVGCPFSANKYWAHQEAMRKQPDVERKQDEARKTPYERCIETSYKMRSDNDRKDFELNVCDRIPYQ